jgi:hypothetical protein
MNPAISTDSDNRRRAAAFWLSGRDGIITTCL